MLKSPSLATKHSWYVNSFGECKEEIDLGIIGFNFSAWREEHERQVYDMQVHRTKRKRHRK
jgi:hypothetical protein